MGIRKVEWEKCENESKREAHTNIACASHTTNDEWSRLSQLMYDCIGTHFLSFPLLSFSFAIHTHRIACCECGDEVLGQKMLPYRPIQSSHCCFIRYGVVKHKQHQWIHFNRFSTNQICCTGLANKTNEFVQMRIECIGLYWIQWQWQ